MRLGGRSCLDHQIRNLVILAFFFFGVGCKGLFLGPKKPGLSCSATRNQTQKGGLLG